MAHGSFIIRSKESILTLITITLSIHLLLPSTVMAARPQTETDFAILPPYCKVRLNEARFPSAVVKWKRILGNSGYLHLHHYCNGLFSLYKAKLSMSSRSQLLRSALNEFAYVDRNWNKDVILRPEMLVKRGETYVLLGQSSKGLEEYQAAIKLKPDYSLPYLKLADYFLGFGNKDEAKKWIELGIKNAPKSKKLKHRLEKLEKSE